jgi:hypothetical protein
MCCSCTKCSGTDNCCTCHYPRVKKGECKRLKWWFVAVKSNTQQSNGSQSFHSGGQGPRGGNSFPVTHRNQSAGRNIGVLRVKEQVWVSERQKVFFLYCCKFGARSNKLQSYFFSSSSSCVSSTWNYTVQSVRWRTDTSGILVACRTSAYILKFSPHAVTLIFSSKYR